HIIDGYITKAVVNYSEPGLSPRLMEHRLIAQRALSKPLPALAVVHHVNGVRGDNSSGNLVLCQDTKYHRLLHARARRLRQTGSLDLKKCGHCHTVKPTEAFCRAPDKWDGLRYCCKECDKTWR